MSAFMPLSGDRRVLVFRFLLEISNNRTLLSVAQIANKRGCIAIYTITSNNKVNQL